MDEVNKYKCNCGDGYIGKNCEQGTDIQTNKTGNKFIIDNQIHYYRKVNCKVLSVESFVFLHYSVYCAQPYFDKYGRPCNWLCWV